ncbi:unnamed protein product [Cuscuta epithymum]|uniref:GrpE protein homolog n=1 Tax=Cuscuta epithymum TaxID=186058 RepID=A0AAV0DP97_9ASTE|nr:unnamed protein product [Cuscuta epithymum]CAH9128760.1 unnamed protein product [Cuscuta epithymum]
MVVSRIASRISKSALAQCRDSLIIYARQQKQQTPTLSNRFHSICYSQQTIVPGHVPLMCASALNSSRSQWFGMSSSASMESNEKETAQASNEQENKAEHGSNTSLNTDAESCDETNKSDMEDLSRDDLVKLMLEMEEKLKGKQKEVEQMKDKVLRSYADMENTMDRNRRQTENSKKFAIQNFAKSLLDVADNLSRASSVVKERYSQIDVSSDATGSAQLLKTLLEGVEMTEKQLAEVFKKFGVEKYDPVDEEFDPNKHNAVFQVPDPSKKPGTVAVVLKSGYTLHERIIRPAEVGVALALENEAADKGSES